jgi:HD superfamily phosphodiesterase
LLKDRVAIEMKRYFKQDFNRIGRATRMARYAERIGKKEGGNLAVVLTAAYLYDIGIKEAEVMGDDSDHKVAEGSQPARQMLMKLGAREELVQEVCRILARNQRSQPGHSVNDRIVYDANLIVNLEERGKESPKGSKVLAEEVESLLLTQTGKEVAGEVLLRSP